MASAIMFLYADPSYSQEIKSIKKDTSEIRLKLTSKGLRARSFTLIVLTNSF